MKKLLLIVLALAMCLSMFACGEGASEAGDQTPGTTSSNDLNGAGNNTSGNNSNNDSNSNDSNSNNSGEQKADIKVWQNLSEGICWATYEQGGKTYLAMADGAGNVLAAFSNDYYLMEPFYEGYARLLYADGKGGECIVVDKTGKIVHRYTRTTYCESYDQSIIMENRGYVITRTNPSGFDAKDFTYTLYDRTGETLKTFVTETEITKATYYGKGVFKLPTIGYYCLETDVIVSGDSYIDPAFEGSEAVIHADRDALIIMDYKGNTKNIALNSERYSLESSAVYGDKILLSKDDILYVFNYKTGKYAQLETQYAEKWQNGVEKISEGHIVLRMEGDDGKCYVGVFDESLKLIGEPVLASFSSQIVSGRLLTWGYGVHVYNENCEKVYSLSDKRYINASTVYPAFEIEETYCEGLLLAYSNDGKKNAVCFDINGNILFEELTLRNITPME